MLGENLRKVSGIWEKEGLELAKPFSKEELLEKFANLKIPFSQDAVEVYSNLGGMIDSESDSTFFSFWTIERLIEENEANSELVYFADFLINSHFYGFKFENEFVSSIHIYWSETQIEKIAESFDEFFETYLISPENYYLFGRENKEKILLQYLRQKDI